MAFVAHFTDNKGCIFVHKGQTLLDAALHQGYAVPYGCQQGSCGTCAMILKQGQVSYPDLEPIGLEEEEVEANFILTCAAVPETDLVITAPALIAPWELPVQKLPFLTAQHEILTDSVVKLLLEPPTNAAMTYLAGQYVYIYASTGEKRPFSIANAPLGGKHIELHIRHTADNAFTTDLLDAVKHQRPIWLEGPYGRCIYNDVPGQPLIFMAGGTGFSQAKALIEQILATTPDLPIHLFWGSKTPEDLYLNALPQHWAQTHPNFRYTPTISRQDEQANWQGHTHTLPSLVTQYYPDLSQAFVFASGPQTLVFDALRHFELHGLSKNYMRSDAFD